MDCNNFAECIDSLEKNRIGSCDSRECIMSSDTRKIVTFEENKKKYVLNNITRDEIVRFHVDGGMFTSNDVQKCDNLAVDIDSKIAIFVELKGTDLRHGLEQISVVLNRLEQGLNKYRIYARIVTSNRTNVPNIRVCPQYVALNRKVQQYGGDVMVKPNIITEDISDFT